MPNRVQVTGVTVWAEKRSLPSPQHPLPAHPAGHWDSQPGDIISKATPGTTCLDFLTVKAPRKNPCQVPKPPQLPSFDVEEQWLYFESLLNDPAPCPISKGQPSHSSLEETNFCCLYPRLHSFGYYSELVTIGEGRKIDWLINRQLHFHAQLSL